jgi:hypothetical protein
MCRFKAGDSGHVGLCALRWDAVWVVNPRSKTITVYLSGGEINTLAEDSIREGGDVLPGYHCPVADVFPYPIVSVRPDGSVGVQASACAG